MASALTVQVGKVVTVVARPRQAGGGTAPNAPTGTITWTTSDGTKATVAPADNPYHQAANITGVAVGSATITATSDNGQSNTCVVTVAASTSALGAFDIQVGSPLTV